MRSDEPLDDRLEQLLTHLDHPMPQVTAEHVMRRARARRRLPRSMLQRAAAVLVALAMGAGVAWAAPGSPLPGWIDAALARVRGGAVDEGERSSPEAASGIALPGESIEVVRVSGGAEGGWMTATLGDGDEVEVRSASPATRFTSEPGALVIEHPSYADTLRVVLPRAGRIEIRVGGEAVLRLLDGSVTSSVPVRSDGGWLLGIPPAG